MNHKQLKYFLALADTLHFSRASEQCFVSPPTLSRQIKQLEEEVGSALFLRDNRSVSLTPQGRAFIHYAKATLASWRQFKTECQDDSRPLAGELSLFCSVTATYSFIYDLFSRFRAEFPAIELNLVTGDPAHSVAQVVSGKEDFAVAVKPKTLPQGLDYLEVGRSRLVFIAPTMNCPLRDTLDKNATGELPWEQLSFILPEQGVLKERIEEFCKQRQFIPKVYAHVSGHEAMVALTSLGFGIAYVPEIVLEQSPFKNQVQILKLRPEEIEIGLIVKSKRLSDPVIKALWKTAQELFSQ